MNLVFITVLALLNACAGNDVPIIGIVPQPCSSEGTCKTLNANATSYLPASYVEWIQMSGAKSIPLYFTYTSAELDLLLSSLNGVLICGGGASTDPWSQYERFIQLLMMKTRQFHHDVVNRNQSIPVWGTCDGFENMLTAVAEGGESVMGTFNASGINLPIQWNMTNVGDSVMFDLNDGDSKYYEDTLMVIDLLANASLSFNDHSKGITPDIFEADACIRTNFTALGISKDLNGQPFVTLMESHRSLGLNWYGSQFHPEKPLFEFESETIVHNSDATIVNSWFSRFFVQ